MRNDLDKTFFYELNLVLNSVAKKLINNENLCKYLYYNEKNPLEQPELTIEQRTELMDKKIFTIPRTPFTDEQGSSIIIGLDRFESTNTNRTFIEYRIEFNVYSHVDLWTLERGLLRPYMILHEIHQMMQGDRTLGIGRLQFGGCRLSILDDSIAGYTTSYDNVDFGVTGTS